MTKCSLFVRSISACVPESLALSTLFKFVVLKTCFPPPPRTLKEKWKICVHTQHIHFFQVLFCLFFFSFGKMDKIPSTENIVIFFFLFALRRQGQPQAGSLRHDPAAWLRVRRRCVELKICPGFDTPPLCHLQQLPLPLDYQRTRRRNAPSTPL